MVCEGDGIRDAMSDTNRQRFGSVDGWIDGRIACKQLEEGMVDELWSSGKNCRLF